MFCSKTFKNPVFLLSLIAVFVLLVSLFLNTNHTMAAGIYPYCRGPLQNEFGISNDQFNCPLSGVSQNDSNYPYICTDNWDGVGPPTSGELYCAHYQNSSLRYDCIGSQAGSTNTGSEWWIEGCSLANTNPAVITATAVAVSSSQIDLSWTTTGIVVNQRIERQIWQFNTWLTQQTFWINSNVRTFSDFGYDPGLTSNTNYRYDITVINGVSRDDEFAFATTLSDSTPPAQITNLSVSSCSSASCSLSWTASIDNVGGSGLGGYRIYRNGTQVGTAAANATTYTDPGLSSLTSYNYYIIAYDNASNSSSQSNTVVGTTVAVPDTTAPTSLNPNLQATRDITNPSSQINISWNAYTDNVGVSGYRIERCQGAGCSNFGFLTNVTSGTSYNDSNGGSGLPSSTSFSYRIQAYDAVPNLSGYSNIASASTSAPPDTSAPNFTPTSPSDPLPAGTTSAILRGDTNEGATCRYAVSSQSFDSMPPMIAMATTDGITHSSPLSNLSDNQSYTYYIKCRDGAGNTSNDFVISFSVAAPPPDTSPPLISGGQPSGVLPYFSGGSGTVTMSVLTNEAAYCRYSQAVDMDFSLMAPNPLNTNPVGDLLYQKYHFTTLTVINGLNYRYYIRCQDTTGPDTNMSGYPIIFSVATPPNILPTVNLSVAPTSGDAPLFVNASGSGNDSDGDLPLTYSLDWGDGFSEVYISGTSVPHTYNTAGSYTVTLTVADSRGGRASATEYITANVSQQVQPPPPITGGICAVECNDDPTCVSIRGAGFVCGPSHICVPEAALDVGPVRSSGYASLLDGTVLSNFTAGTSAVTIGLTTDANAECRFAVDPLANNGIANVDYANSIMRPFSTSDYINHFATINIGNTKSCTPGASNACGYNKENVCPASGKCDSYGFSAICRNTFGTLESNTTDYPILFSIGAPGLLACVPVEMCPSGLECPSSGTFIGRCAPAPYTCSINQFFVRNNIPYLLDICFPGLTPLL